ncbi:MAG: glutamate mutase L [Chloroflexota bacterium]
MPASLVEGDSVLAVDVGGARTRAALFDIVEGEYRFVAAGAAASTAEAPFRDVGAGVRAAIADLQAVTGRSILNTEGQLITPGQSDGSGVDAFVSTLSAGPTLKTAIVGLLSDVSVESARRLAETCYMRVVDSAGINDPRQADRQIDSLMRLQPDAVVIAGGTDGGASRSVQKMLEPVGLAAFLLAPEKRPAVLFAGNQVLQSEVRELLGNVTAAMHFSPNVRPSLDTEDLGPAARELASLYLGLRRRQLRGIEQLEAWSGGTVLPTAYAAGRMMRFLSKVYGGSHGAVLGIDLGTSAAVVTAGFSTRTTLRVYPQFGLGENLPSLLQYTTLEDILRWSPLDISTGALRDFLYQKSLYPSSIAATKEDQLLAQAVARQALYLAVQAASRDFPRTAQIVRPGLLPFFEPILANGGALADAATPAEALLLLLDAIQPVGIATIILDRSDLLPLLGAIAERNSMLPVQVLDTGAFQSLGTIVSVIGAASEGTPIARAHLVYENGVEARADIKHGNLELLPLPTGENARLSIQPRHGINVGFGTGRAGTVIVSGGTLGVVFDGRGRPLNLPQDSGRRRELLKKWLWTVGG